MQLHFCVTWIIICKHDGAASMNDLKPARCWREDHICWWPSALLLGFVLLNRTKEGARSTLNTFGAVSFGTTFPKLPVFLHSVLLHCQELLLILRNIYCETFGTFNIFLQLLTKKYFNTLTLWEKFRLLFTALTVRSLSRVGSEEKQTVRGLLPSFKKSESIIFWIRRVAFSGADDGSCWGDVSFPSDLCCELHMCRDQAAGEETADNTDFSLCFKLSELLEQRQTTK